MLNYITIFSLFLFSFSFFSAYGAVDEISTDKSVYFDGDTLFISGSVSSEMENPSVNVIVFAPLHSTIQLILKLSNTLQLMPSKQIPDNYHSSFRI